MWKIVVQDRDSNKTQRYLFSVIYFLLYFCSSRVSQIMFVLWSYMLLGFLVEFAVQYIYSCFIINTWILCASLMISCTTWSSWASDWWFLRKFHQDITDLGVLSFEYWHLGVVDSDFHLNLMFHCHLMQNFFSWAIMGFFLYFKVNAFSYRFYLRAILPWRRLIIQRFPPCGILSKFGRRP